MTDPEHAAGAGRTVALVFSGGVALGAYHAGAYAAFDAAGGPAVDWVAGSSIGAVTAAIIAGNPPERRVDRLRRLWDGLATDPSPLPSDAAEWGRCAAGWASVVQARMLGRPGLFRPRLLPWLGEEAPAALYDLAPLRDRLQGLVDFALLNDAAAPRLSIAATDLASGERVVFDNRRRGAHAPIGPEHLIASCALLPDFAPVAVEGRLLADGGLSGNAPLDLVLDEPGQEERLCFVLDLFARRDDRPPRSLADGAGRTLDLLFSAQTALTIEGRRREWSLRARLRRLAAKLPPALRADADLAALLAEAPTAVAVVRLSHRASAGDPGFQKTFDFSGAALRERWEAGGRDMRAALRRVAAWPAEGGRAEADGLTVIDLPCHRP